MTRLTYSVVRRPGGWAVEYDERVLCCYRNFEQAVAMARQLGRDGWEGGRQPCEVQVEVQGCAGTFRTEVTYGYDQPAA